MNIKNPWDLSEKQVLAIEAVTRVGSTKAAARVMKVDHKTVENHLQKVREKMDAANTLVAAVQWDRFVRAQS